MAPKNLDSLLNDLVDIGLVVKDIVNKSFLSAIRKGISLVGSLKGNRDWRACGEELLNLSNEERAVLQANLAQKLKVLQDEKVESKIVEGLGLLIEAVDYAEQGVGVGKKLAQFIRGA